MVAVHVFERRFLGDLVQRLQQEAEAQVPLKRLVQNREAALQFRVAAKRQYLMVGSFVGSGHGSALFDVQCTSFVPM